MKVYLQGKYWTLALRAAVNLKLYLKNNRKSSRAGNSLLKISEEVTLLGLRPAVYKALRERFIMNF